MYIPSVDHHDIPSLTIIQYTTGTYYEHTIIRYHPHAIIRLDSVLIPSEGATNATNAHTISTHS